MTLYDREDRIECDDCDSWAEHTWHEKADKLEEQLLAAQSKLEAITAGFAIEHEKFLKANERATAAESSLDTAADLAVLMAKERKDLESKLSSALERMDRARGILRKNPQEHHNLAMLDTADLREPVVENPVTIATDRTNERQTCNHCGNPVPCACW